MAVHLRLFLVAVIAAGTLCLFPNNAHAQRRDYLTDAEIELVRDAQDIDQRIEVLTRAVDRRFSVLKIDIAALKSPAKESDKWGDPPTGSRFELLDDIRRLLQKAIDDIDNVAAHPVDPETQAKINKENQTSDKQAKKDSQRFPNAVRRLGSAAQRYLPIFKNLLDKSADEKEKGAILDSIEFCEQIIEAQQKVGEAPAKTKT